MAQLLSSRMVWQEPVTRAAEDATKQADLVDEAKARGLEVEGEPYDACYDVTVRGGLARVVALAKWALGRGVEVNAVNVGHDEDLELAQRELGAFDVEVSEF